MPNPPQPTSPASPFAAARQRLAWIYRTKLKVLAWLLGITLATIGSISLAGIPILPAIGMAVAAAAMSVSKTTCRLNRLTCLSCGDDLTNSPIGAHGTVCGACGSVNQPARASKEMHVADDDRADT